MQIQESDHLPLYARIESALAADIAGGSLAPGDQIPAEDRLIARFAVSRTTVRKAVENLVARGLLEIRRGRGTFVAAPRLRQELTALTGFVEDMVALGRNPTARLLGIERVPAAADVARHLDLAAGAIVYRIERVRLADGAAVSFDETFLPEEIGARIAEADLEAVPIFTLLEETCGLPLVEAQYQLEAAAADRRAARALGVKAGSPIFLIERTSFTERGRPVDYEKLHYRGELIKFVTRLPRRPRP
jgi:GntR family transcriptional regulator